MKNWFDLLIALLFVLITQTHTAAQAAFSSGTIQIGVVVSDFNKSLDFYTKVLGMQQTGGFALDEKFTKESGLSNGVPFKVTILKLQDDPQATEWKLLSFNKKARHPRQKHVQDDTGLQYVTMYVTAMKPFLERLKQNNIPLLGQTPVTLKNGNQFVLIQDPDGTFIELIGPAE